MPKTQREDDKKHGDPLESLIDRTGSGASAPQRGAIADEDDPARRDDEDEDDDQDDDEDEDQDEAEHLEPGDVEDRGDPAR